MQFWFKLNCLNYARPEIDTVDELVIYGNIVKELKFSYSWNLVLKEI